MSSTALFNGYNESPGNDLADVINNPPENNKNNPAIPNAIAILPAKGLIKLSDCIICLPDFRNQPDKPSLDSVLCAIRNLSASDNNFIRLCSIAFEGIFSTRNSLITCAVSKSCFKSSENLGYFSRQSSTGKPASISFIQFSRLSDSSLFIIIHYLNFFVGSLM